MHGAHANARKTRCKRGHRLVVPNLVASSLPRRDCKACARARSFVRDNPTANLIEIAEWNYRSIMRRQAA